MANTYQTALRGKRDVAHETTLFEFDRPEGFEYRAGQTIDLTIPNPPYTDEKGAVRTFSLVSAPHEESLMVTTRMRGSAFKNSLKELPEGSPLSIEGPFGSFTLHQKEERPAVFLAGGIGITPFMSMAKDAAHRGLPHRLYLFYSNRTPEDAAFLEELQQLDASHPQFTLVATMTDTENSGQEWSGEHGYITMDMIDRHVESRQTAIFYLAGPQGMVSAMRKMLAEAGVSEDDVSFEEFAGY